MTEREQETEWNLPAFFASLATLMVSSQTSSKEESRSQSGADSTDGSLNGSVLPDRVRTLGGDVVWRMVDIDRRCRSRRLFFMPLEVGQRRIVEVEGIDYAILRRAAYDAARSLGGKIRCRRVAAGIVEFRRVI